MDCASSEFYNKENGMYEMKGEGKSFTSQEFTHYLERIMQRVPNRVYRRWSR